MYHCAQIDTRQHQPKKEQREGAKTRDKGQLDTFSCDGWLHITIFDGEDVTYVKLKHKCDSQGLRHPPYWCIDVPKEVENHVKENFRLRLKDVSFKTPCKILNSPLV
jgi:hypothetical protein